MLYLNVQRNFTTTLSKLLPLVILKFLIKFCTDKHVSCFNQLPIAEYDEEEARGSFYFKMFGKELIYNYFTYDDVRELIEDGVIRVNNDLKDMLKKGKSALLIIKKLAVSRSILSLLFCFCFCFSSSILAFFY